MCTCAIYFKPLNPLSFKTFVLTLLKRFGLYTHFDSVVSGAELYYMEMFV